MLRLLPRPAAALLLLALASAGCAGPRPNGDFGVLVMAHGGSAEWNADVMRAVAPLRGRYPVEVAFGMADPASMQAAVDRLEARGARRIGVVRLFVSGESFLDRTRLILGLEEGAPARPAHAAGHDHGGHRGHSMAIWRVESDAAFAISTAGLADDPGMGDVLVARARALSREPAAEEVLILAHGPGDDAENARWLAALDRRAEAVRRALPFARVAVATLREDWPDKRAPAEAAARAFVDEAAAAGRTAIVIPFRVSGFGSYAEVLAGREYRADGRGLLPHPAVTSWIERQARELAAAPSGTSVPAEP